MPVYRTNRESAGKASGWGGNSSGSYIPGSRGGQLKAAGPGSITPLDGLLKQFGLGNTGYAGGSGQRPAAAGPSRPPTGGPDPRTGSGAGGPIPNFSLAAQKNPEFTALSNAYQQYRSGLAAGNDQDAQFAMQRQRDLMSGLAKEYQGEASARGILNTGAAQQDMLNKIVNPGQQQLGQLNANLTSDARRQQLSALSGQAGVAGQQANFLQGQQQIGLEAWKAQQQNEIDRAGIQAMQQNQSINQLLALMGTLGNFYTGF
jgi:hypothetical protein